MQTKTYNTWKFEELTEEQQEKAIEKHRYFNVEDDIWHEYDGMTGFTAKELQRMKIDVKDAPDDLITFKKLYFDIGRDYYIQFVDASFSNDEIARKFLRVPANIWNHTNWTIEDQPSRYGNTRLAWEWEGDNEITKKQEEILNRAVEIFADKISEALSDLRSSYEYLLTDEAVKESLISNDYDFTANGEID